MSMKHCSSYTLEDLSRFMDQELPETMAAEIRDHLDQCPDCSARVKTCRQLTQGFLESVDSQAQTMTSDTMALELKTRINKHRGNRSGFRARFFGGRKILLQAVTIVAIILSTVAYFEMQPAAVPQPSAIVTLVDGSASSVMILETQQQHHTIIWYTES